MSFGQDDIRGNVSEEVKKLLRKPGDLIMLRPTPDAATIFGESIADKVVVTEMTVEKKVEEPQKLEGRLICEVTVEEGSLPCCFLSSTYSVQKI
jgi:acyl-coenzyme A thioesterase 13